MASFWQRLSIIFGAKANKVLDRVEDPRETLDYSYDKQVQLLAKVRRGVADVATSRKRVEMQRDGLNKQAANLQVQAEKAISLGREDLAREALTRKAGLTSQITDLTGQVDNLRAEEEKLTTAQRRLQSQVEAFRTRKETVKATYTAAQAQVKINESLSGIGNEFETLGGTLARAEDQVAQMQARAGATDELVASGAFESVTSGDSIQRELDALTATSGVEAELAALKAKTKPQALPAGHATSSLPVIDVEAVEG